MQAHSDLLLLLFAFNHQNYSQYLTQHHVEFTNLSITKSQAFSFLETFDLGARPSGNKFSTIPGDLVTEVTITRKVKVGGGPMRGGYSPSIDAKNDFILRSDILAKLRKELKNKMNLKTVSNHKESTPIEIKKHEEQIAGLIGSLNEYGDPFHRAE